MAAARAGRWLGASMAIGLAAACTVTPGTPTKPGGSTRPGASAAPMGASARPAAPRALPSVPLTADFATIFEPYTRPTASPANWAVRSLRDAEMAVPGDWRMLDIESVPVQVDGGVGGTIDLGIPGLAPIAIPSVDLSGTYESMLKWNLSIFNPARHRIQQKAREDLRKDGIQPIIREDQEPPFEPEATSTADPNDKGWVVFTLAMAETEGRDEVVTQFFTDWEDKFMHKRGRVLLAGAEAYYMVSTAETLAGEPAEFFKFFVQREDSLYMMAATRHRTSAKGATRTAEEKKLNGEILAMLETFRWKGGAIEPEPAASVTPSASAAASPEASPSASPSASASP